MNAKALLLLVVVAVGATSLVGGTAQVCEQYPFGYSYRNIGRVFSIATTCLSSIKVTEDECAYAAISGAILATAHEPYANSDFRKTVPYVSACLRKSSVNQASIDKVEQCLIDGIGYY